MGIVTGLGVLLGVQAGRQGQLGLAVTMIVAGALMSLLLRRPERLFALVALCGFGIGFFATDLRQTSSEPANSQLYAADAYVLTVIDDARVAGRGWGARARVSPVSGGEQSVELFAFFPHSVRPAPGMRLEVLGRIPPERNDLMFIESARVVQLPSRLERERQRIRKWLEDRVQDATTGSAGTLALGLLIGDDSALTGDERETFRRAGLSHITAVSGWNVTVVVGMIALIFRSFGLTNLRWLAIQVFGIIAYVWLVGIEPPIVRAAIMGSLVLVATVPGRPVHLLTLLALSAAVMALQDPNVLSSLAFQLSFLSMIGLSISPRLNVYEEGWKRGAMYALLVPILAGIWTAPVILARFGYYSILSIPANIVVAPLTTPLAASALLAALLSAIPILALIPSIATWLLGTTILVVSDVVGAARFGSLEMHALGVHVVVAIYLMLFLLFSMAISELRWLLALGEERLRVHPAPTIIGCSSAAGVLLIGGLVLGG